MSWELSSRAEIDADLTALYRPFDFTKGEIGARACRVSAETIMELCEAEEDYHGWPWPDLSPMYEEWKSKVAPGAPMAVLHGHMRQMDQLEGEQVITTGEVTHGYGIDEEARTEAMKFQEGGLVTGTNQPPRPFWGIGARLKMRLDRLFDSVWTAMLK